ncbi:MAG: hypothetical protein ACJ76H_03085 [Bacteriovoracaceae bacterium]
MKYLAFFIILSTSAFAQLPDMSKLKDMSKQVLDACKDDKSKIHGCESYTEMGKLKTCLLANKEKLSDKCKTSLKLVK